MIIIPDISFWQDDPTTQRGIDFRIMRKQTPAVIIRAGQNSWTDINFVKSWKAAKEAGLKRGAYWFYDSRADPKRQAELFAELLKDDPPELEAWADFEDRYGGSFSGWRHWYVFLERLKELVPCRVGIYTGYYYWLENMVGATQAQVSYFGQYPLWIAAYGNKPYIPKPWKEYLYWQFTDNGDGAKYGVESGNIDLNYYNGDEVGNSPTLQAHFGNKIVEYRSKNEI